MRWSKKKQFLLLWFLIVISYTFYAEYLIYTLKTQSWPLLACQDENACTRILLVADPQLIGDHNEIFHPVTPFSIFDSDRYLKLTYFYAYNFVRPHIVIFLGDLMDESHTATDQEFNGYVRRVFNIFLAPYDNMNVKHIWLPGDNDIGGEDTPVTPKKLQRFERAFSQSSMHTRNNITFFKINRLTSIIPVYKKEREFYDTTKIFVGLSHVPLMFRPSLFTEKVITKMSPHVLFTAHEHKSMIISTDALLHKDYHIVPITPDNVQIYKYSLGVQDMYEILIPTCSYRMGTNKIGYVSAIIENNELQFTNLWSPGRFEQLAMYLVVIVLPLIMICFFKFCAFVRRKLLKKGAIVRIKMSKI